GGPRGGRQEAVRRGTQASQSGEDQERRGAGEGASDEEAVSRRGVPGALAGLLAAGLLGAVPAPASAETARVVDERGTALQGPANQLLSGRLTYTRDRTVLVARVERLSRARTWVGGSLYYPDDSYVKVSVTHRSGELVVRGHYHQADEDP